MLLLWRWVMPNYGLYTEKAQELAEAEGFDDPIQLCKEVFNSGLIPGICTSCDYTTLVEPDQDKGYCEFCETQTVVSLMVLLEII